MIFETERLTVRILISQDADPFFDMMSNPNVMDPIPRPVMKRAESDAFLDKLISAKADSSYKNVWAIVEKKSNFFIGLCAYLKNDENNDEIGYRLREQFWRIGYGTEKQKG
ncbi:MAG: GNAT family N-acetyltransferase [Flavobacteriaceae bacterium]|nr:GNAT family N-acetyltransferase [Flavobacteriaceae bacterium]